MVNEHVSVKQVKDLMGGVENLQNVKLVSDLLNTIDVKTLRYISIERTDLTISLDNVKTLLAGLINSENYQGVSIVTMRFYNGRYATAIIQYRGLTNFDALVFSSTTVTLPPYNLSYVDGSWIDILLASGRQQAGSTNIFSTTVSNNTLTDLRTITLTQGVWNAEVMVIFPANSIGNRKVVFKGEGSYYLYSNKAFDGGIHIVRANKTYFVNNETTKELTLQANQDSGVEMNVSYILFATRLS